MTFKQERERMNLINNLINKMSIQERNKPFDTTSLETIVGKDAELFNADVSHKPNYKLIDCSPIGMARTETWGGKVKTSRT